MTFIRLGLNAFDIIFLVSLAMSAVLVAAIILARRGRRNAWGREYGLKRKGKRWTGEAHGAPVEVELVDETPPVENPSHELYGGSRLVAVRATAGVTPPLPRGFILSSTAVVGESGGAPIQTGDADFDARFLVLCENAEASQTLLGSETTRTVLINIAASSERLRIQNDQAQVIVSAVQRFADDPGELLTKGYRAAVRAAHVMSSAMQGKDVKGADATRRVLSRNAGQNA